MNDFLRDSMNALAEDVREVDLRARVQAGSRRRARQRATMASIAVVAVVALGSVGAIQLAGRQAGPEFPPGDPTASVSGSPRASASPSPSPSVDPAKLTGAFHYLSLGGDGARIYTVRGESSRLAGTMVPESGMSDCVGNSIVISPDGTKVAWVGIGSDQGPLYMANIDGSGKRLLNTEVLCLGSTSVVWSADSASLTYLKASDGESFQVAVADGRVSPAGSPARVWSADGRLRVTANDEGMPIIVSTDGGAPSGITYTGQDRPEAENYDGWQVRSLAVDGRYAAIGWSGTDPSRHLDSFAIIDIETGQEMPLPVTDLDQVHFLADGRVLLQTLGGRIVVLNKDLVQLGQLTEPVAVRDMTLLGYVP